MPKIFISYRRDDSASQAGRLYDRLEGHFGQGQVFMDVDTIKPGVNFVETVQQAIGECDGLVAVIGSDWLQVSDARFRSDVDRLIEALEAPAQDRLADTVFVEPAQPVRSGFVGREREMGELNKALEEALRGQGRMVMLAGEPGIGKTRTAQELASHAEMRGAQVLWGWC